MLPNSNQRFQKNLNQIQALFGKPDSKQKENNNIASIIQKYDNPQQVQIESNFQKNQNMNLTNIQNNLLNKQNMNQNYNQQNFQNNQNENRIKINMMNPPHQKNIDQDIDYDDILDQILAENDNNNCQQNGQENGIQKLSFQEYVKPLSQRISDKLNTNQNQENQNYSLNQENNYNSFRNHPQYNKNLQQSKNQQNVQQNNYQQNNLQQNNYQQNNFQQNNYQNNNIQHNSKQNYYQNNQQNIVNKKTNNFQQNNQNNVAQSYQPPAQKKSKQSLKKINYIYADVSYWTLTKFPWDADIDACMKNIFNITKFRQNQRGAINATKSKQNVFTCMPTGGGKSLLFQIPSLTDPGITIVVMPLISLICDQVAQMQNFGIPTGSLTSQISLQAQKDMMNSCFQTDNFPKIIYLTPEKISQSGMLMTFLFNLYRQKKLDRFVIDEAHCVSNWGRDFRPDYVKLNILKENFPEVPLLALTATATEQVKQDVVEILKIRDCQYFQCSFNRSNLIYDIREKKPATQQIEDIATYVKNFYKNKCGIIYCSSRKSCEEVSANLNIKYKLKSGFYHGSMPDKQKNQVQNDWMAGDLHIIVATIAFGMGINKPDVRFVIHYDFSKSIENYYQETGRAGRDGKQSQCVLYYRFSDRLTLHILQNNKEHSKKMNSNQSISDMIAYCENKSDCRREILLDALGESFNRQHCNKMCDNCRKELTFEEFECFSEVEQIVSLVFGFLTFNQLVDNLKGKAQKNNKKKYQNNDGQGMLKEWKKEKIENLIKSLIYTGVLFEKVKEIKKSCYLYLNVDRTRFNQIKAQRTFKIRIMNESSENIAMKQEKEKIKQEKQQKLEQLKQEKLAQAEKKVKLQKNENNPIPFPQQEVSKKNDISPVIIVNQSFSQYVSKKPKNVKIFDSEYGYCDQDQYDEIMERLKLKRNNLYQKYCKTLSNPTNIEAFLSTTILAQVAKYLPLNESDFSNVSQISKLQLQNFVMPLIAEINYFLSYNPIKKEDFVIFEEENNKQNDIFEIQNYLNQKETPEYDDHYNDDINDVNIDEKQLYEFIDCDDYIEDKILKVE